MDGGCFHKYRNNLSMVSLFGDLMLPFPIYCIFALLIFFACAISLVSGIKKKTAMHSPHSFTIF